MKYLKKFATTAQYEAYTADTENFITPNVSICNDNPTAVHYNSSSPTPPTPIGTNLSYRLSEDDNNYYVVLGNGEYEGGLFVVGNDSSEDIDQHLKYNPSNGICTLITWDDLPEDTWNWSGYGFSGSVPKGQTFTRTVNGETYTFTPVSGNDEQWTISPEINQYD